MKSLTRNLSISYQIWENMTVMPLPTEIRKNTELEIDLALNGDSTHIVAIFAVLQTSTSTLLLHT